MPHVIRERNVRVSRGERYVENTDTTHYCINASDQVLEVLHNLGRHLNKEVLRSCNLNAISSQLYHHSQLTMLDLGFVLTSPLY